MYQKHQFIALSRSTSQVALADEFLSTRPAEAVPSSDYTRSSSSAVQALQGKMTSSHSKIDVDYSRLGVALPGIRKQKSAGFDCVTYDALAAVSPAARNAFF